MPPMNHNEGARHARLFEFLRQSHQAEMTTKRLSQPPMRKATGPAPEDWRARAIKTLDANPTTSRA